MGRKLILEIGFDGDLSPDSEEDITQEVIRGVDKSGYIVTGHRWEDCEDEEGEC